MRTDRKEEGPAEHTEKGGMRNFQQLLRLKLMRQQRRNIMPAAYLKQKLPGPMGRWEVGQGQKKLTNQKELIEHRTLVEQKGKLAEIVRRHSKEGGSSSSRHIKDCLTQTKPNEYSTITPRYKVLLDDVRHRSRQNSQISSSNPQLIQPVHTLRHSQLQQVRSIQQHFIRAREQLIGKGVRAKRSTASLQSKGRRIVPLAAPCALGSFNRVVTFRVLDCEGQSEEQRERLKTCSRYNQIPISQFIYESARRIQSVSSGLQKKLELICRRGEGRAVGGDDVQELEEGRGAVGRETVSAAFG